MSISNRGNYGNKFCGIWKRFAWDTSGWIARAGDFYAIYEAGNQALLGRGVFKVQPEMNFLSREDSKMRAPYCATFRYPPLFAYTFAVALNLFPPEMSYKFWIVFNELLIFLGIYLTARIAASMRAAFWSMIVWLSFYPLHIEYYLGQFSLFMGFMIFFAAYSFIMKRERSAIFFWGASLFIKVYTLPFIIYWIFRKKYKLPVLILLIFIITSGIYFVIFPSDFDLFYKRGIAGRLYPTSAAEGVLASDEKSAEGLTADVNEKKNQKSPALYWGSMGVQRGALALSRLFYLKQDARGVFMTPHFAKYLLFFVMLFPIPFLILAAHRGEKNPALVLSLFSLSLFFWYFDTWEHHYVMLLPILALLVALEVIKGARALIICILIASPSLWIFFSHSLFANPLTPQSPAAYFFIETLYYLIKPAGVLMLFFSLFKKSGSFFSQPFLN